MNVTAVSRSPGQSFVGLVAVVTGGASGIGLATVELLAGSGALVACLDRTPTPARTSVLDVRVDVRDDASVRAAIDEVVARYGAIDVLVNNAGVGAQGTVEDNSDHDWHDVFDVNVLGAVRVTRSSLGALRRSAHASIVNTGSVVASVGLPQRALYSATKGAVQSLTLAMAADHLADGIRVNCVSPGTADTPWVQRLLDSSEDPAAARAALEGRQPMGRLVTAEEVAAAITYLASPAAASVTGTILTVDGGLTGLRVPGR